MAGGGIGPYEVGLLPRWPQPVSWAQRPGHLGSMRCETNDLCNLGGAGGPSLFVVLLRST